jgi:DNA-binding MarR family transcriptional regulator
MTPPPVPTPIPVGEEAARKRVGELDVDLPSMAAISNLFRAVNAARNYIERKVLRDYSLTFSGFTTLWVLWVMGSMETRHLAAEASVTKGTLTGILKTLEDRGLVTRETPETDRRLTLVHLTQKGEQRMQEIFPRFNAAERDITSALDDQERDELVATLRHLLTSIDDLEKGEAVKYG